jgi:hypothetical protein
MLFGQIHTQYILHKVDKPSIKGALELLDEEILQE